MLKRSVRVIGRKSIVLILINLLFLSFTSCINSKDSKQNSSNSSPLKSESVISQADGELKAHLTRSEMTIDGYSKESIWASVDWYDMNYKWMGETVDSADYNGRFKLAWNSQYLFVLVEVIDDHLNPTLGNGKENYWKGDYVEVFIDEDKSGGNHKFNHQAFAYHVSTEGHAIDLSTSEEMIFFDDHVEVKRSQKGTKHLWEMAIKLFDKSFDENANDNVPVEIVKQKRIGFSIAYGDNDGKNNRENFMGSKKNHGNNNDEGYVNSDVFGSILFIE